MRNDEAAFMGMVTTGVAKEIEILFATIKRSAGLLDDTVRQIRSGSTEVHEKHLGLLSVIHDQCDRGITFSNILAKFAQSPKRGPVEVDVNEVAEHVSVLCLPFARLSGTALEFSPKVPIRRIACDPLLLSMVFFAAIDIFLALSPFVFGLCLQCGDAGDRVWIDFVWSADDSGDGSRTEEIGAGTRWEKLHELVDALGARTELHESQKRLRIVFPEGYE
jgi:hypothetical protein